MARGVRHPRRPPTLILVALLTISVVLLVLLTLGAFSLPAVSKDGRVAEVHRSVREARVELQEAGEQWTEVLSWEPRAFLFHNFLSKEECKYLIELAKPYMKKSTVVDSTTGRSTDSRVRTSSGMFLRRGQDKIIRAIEKRIADFTFIPVEHGEGLQVLHYEVGQKYEPHYDYFVDEFNTRNGGQRLATLLMYLYVSYFMFFLVVFDTGQLFKMLLFYSTYNIFDLTFVDSLLVSSDVEEGGETVFPSAKVFSSSLPWYTELSECGKKGLSIKPKMGDALLFWSMRPDATLDPSSLHGGCPVIRGNKWSSTKWMHIREFRA